MISPSRLPPETGTGLDPGCGLGAGAGCGVPDAVGGTGDGPGCGPGVGVAPGREMEPPAPGTASGGKGGRVTFCDRIALRSEFSPCAMDSTIARFVASVIP
jgi:hypothetical protein